MRDIPATVLFLGGGVVIVAAIDLWSRLAAGVTLGLFLILVSFLIEARHR